MKPRIFIGSSVEALQIAYAIQENLEHDANVTIWNQGVFELSNNTLDDLIRALNSFDFGIFVFKPDDITHIKSLQKNTVRDNVIFELGLFIGKLGKERVFYLIPKEASDFHLPSDLLGVNAGRYDDKREDGNLNAALGSFCNQVRQKLKGFAYTSLHDLQDESIEAKRIAIEKPYGWEYLLAGELLESRIVAINLSYTELENGLIFIKTKIHTAESYKEWCQEMINDMSKLAEMFHETLKLLTDSFGPPGVPGKIIEIKNAIDKIVSLCKELISWEYRVKEAKPPQELEEIPGIVSGWSKVIMNNVNSIPSEVKRIIQLVKVDPQTNQRIQFRIDTLPNLNRMVEIFTNYFNEKQ